MNKSKNDHAPLVTVAMVTFNSAKYIRTAIESVLYSSYTNFELIISDDNSTDDTWDIIQDYNDLRIIASRNETNLKEYPNRNKCIDLANGEFIMFVDGDDYLFPDTISKCINYFNAFPEVGFILASSGKQSMIFPTLLETDISHKIHFFIEPLFNHSLLQAFFRKKIVKEIGFFSEQFIAGDYDMFLRISAEYDILLINAPLGWWREHSLQASKKLKGIKGILEILKIINKIFKEESNLSEEQKQIIYNQETINLFKYILKHPTFYNIKQLKHLKGYKRLNKVEIPTYQSLGLSLPITKSLNRNPYNMNNYKS